MLPDLPEPIRDAIEAADTPSPPPIILRLLRMLDDEPSNYADIARLIEQDPGLCARVLAAANTPTFRRSQASRNVESSLRALGARLVRVIATCLAVRCLMEERLTPQAVDLAVFWTHSVMVAELSRDIAVMVDYPHPEESYLAGLLHDVGQLILVSSLGEPYLRLLAGCNDESTLTEQEIREFGTHHGQVGTALVDSWQLESSFADGILYHHLAAEEILGATVLPQIVWLAHALSRANEISADLFDAAGQMFPDLDPSRLRAGRQNAERLARQAAKTVGIVIGDTVPGGLTGLARLRESPARDDSDPHSQLASMIGNKALLQTLRQDLFAIEGQEELLLALRESARLLFGLRRVAFVLHDPLSGGLSGKGIAGQAPIFSQTHNFGDARANVMTSAAVSQQIRSTYDQPPPHSLKDQQFARAFASTGLLCIPLLSGTRTVGVMVAGISISQHGRLSPRLPALANFGRIAGHCLEDRRQAQSIREQSEASAALRFTRQARRIVHEAGNPLTIIRGYLRLLDGKLPEQAEVRHELTVLGEEIERVSSIIQRMSDVPPQQAAELALDICDLIRELLLLYRESLFDGRGIRFEAILPTEPIRVCCDADSIKQILLNLWKNASEALSRGQSLTLSLTGNLLHQGRSFAELRLEDDGPGMSATTLKALHQPPGSERLDGTRGIGLSIVGTLTQRLGIPVTCRSQAGEGTIISLLLPTTDEAVLEKKESGTPGACRT